MNAAAYASLADKYASLYILLMSIPFFFFFFFVAVFFLSRIHDFLFKTKPVAHTIVSQRLSIPAWPDKKYTRWTEMPKSQIGMLAGPRLLLAILLNECRLNYQNTFLNRLVHAHTSSITRGSTHTPFQARGPSHFSGHSRAPPIRSDSRRHRDRNRRLAPHHLQGTPDTGQAARL